MSLSEFSHSQRLQEVLLTEIANTPSKQITFAQYMALALYHPQYGYYLDRVRIGSQGDFFTSASLGQDFGQLLAIQLKEMWQNLGCPAPFWVVEMGAGNGELAQDILHYWQTTEPQAFIQAVKYIIIERSPSLIKQQQERLKSFAYSGANSGVNFDLRWQDWSDLAPESIEGCFFSNELVDAFPVHLVQKDQQELKEVYLGVQEGKLTEIVDRLSTEKLTEYFNLIGIDLLQQQYPHGYRTEVNLQGLEWLKTLATKLKRGYVLTIDYGYSAEKYYRPSRSQGTLQCYYQHRRHNNPYANLGYQDLTAHINFTALELYGELSNLHKIGFTQQGLFLMALGIGDRLNELSSGKFSIPEIFKRRDALHQLIDPTGLGGYGVLIQGKNLTDSEQSLQGLTVPDWK
jgi:SAM-dependent MidA family methyltransferase